MWHACIDACSGFDISIKILNFRDVEFSNLYENVKASMHACHIVFRPLFSIFWARIIFSVFMFFSFTFPILLIIIFMMWSKFRWTYSTFKKKFFAISLYSQHVFDSFIKNRALIGCVIINMERRCIYLTKISIN